MRIQKGSKNKKQVTNAEAEEKRSETQWSKIEALISAKAWVAQTQNLVKKEENLWTDVGKECRDVEKSMV